MITDIWNDDSTVYYKIKNVGGKKAESIKTSLTADGSFKTSDSVATLYSMKETTESFDYIWNCTDLNDTVEICADYTNDITETDESNNCRTETLWCDPCIWVDPTSLDVTLPPHVVSDYTLTIGNSGNGAFTFNITDVSGISPQPGWPTTTGDWVASSPALGDIDGDGYLEVVVGSTDGMVYAWHHDGSKVTGWPKRTGDDVWSSPALGDIDGDDDIEIVVGSGDIVYAWHHDGSNVTGWPKRTSDTMYSPALGDIDGDGDIEVVVSSYDGRVYAWHHDGSNVSGWPMATGGYVGSSPALGDIDEDGDIEVVIGSYSYGDGIKVHAWHHNGSNVSGWPTTFCGYVVYSSPALGDIDGDGDIEVVIGAHWNKVYAWHHDGSNVAGWPKTPDGYGVFSSPALGDIDGDGDLEVVVSSGDVHAWHHDGSNVTGWPIPPIFHGWYGCISYSSPTLGDIDGDGDIEVVVGSDDNMMWAWHHDGSNVAGWPTTMGLSASVVASSSPSLGDIDCDGDIEVVVGSSDGKVHAWDCSGTYDPGNIEWGTFHHDVRRTGSYGYTPPEMDGLSEYTPTDTTATGSQTVWNAENWLSEYPTTGTVNPCTQTNVTVSFDTTDLDAGEYSADIIITSNYTDGTYDAITSIPVRLTVAPPSQTQKGDLNHDGDLTPADATIALQLAATGAHNPAADVSGDDRVTSLDALMILQAAAGAITL